MTRPSDELPEAPRPMRLQRFLAQAGLGSRRECEELITTGRVTVDGKTVAQLGATVEPWRQTISLDGERLKVERKKYFMLNKPAGFLCTADDPEGRRRVLDLFPSNGPRLFTVGRLDENTTGLLIVTNDGDLAQRLAHPRYRIFRLYRAQIAGNPTGEVLDELKRGLYFTEGRFRVHDVVAVKKQKGSTWVEITMTEGQNREIRRLFARVGHKVMKLERIGYGPLRLGRLPIGEHRELRREELEKLHAVLDRNQREGSDSGGPSRPPQRPHQRPLSPGRVGRPQGRLPVQREGAPGGSGQRRTGGPPATRPQAGGPRSAAAKRRAASGRTDRRESETGEAGARRPSADRPQSGRTQAGGPQADRPQTGRPVTGKPGAGRPGSAKGRPGTGRPGTGRPAAGTPEANQAGGRPGAGRPAKGRPGGPPKGAPSTGGGPRGAAARRKAGGPPGTRPPGGALPKRQGKPRRSKRR